MIEIARRLVIQGRVQGVGYRDWMQGEARKLGVDGWVRNRRDGTVEALISGSEEAVSALTARCQAGPTFARVSIVDGEPAYPPAETGFFRRPTI